MANKYEDRRVWMRTGIQAKQKNIALEDATIKRTRKIYEKASRDIERQVAQLYGQFSTVAENGRTEFKGLKMPATQKDISALIKAINDAGLADHVPEKLSKRMSVLQVKQLDNWLTIQRAGQQAHGTTKDALGKEIVRQGKVWQASLDAGAGSFVGFDRNIAGYMLGQDWEGGNFSDRLWDRSKIRWEEVREELARAVSNGQSQQTTINHLKQIMQEGHNPNAKGSGGLDYDVQRIVRTELAKASTDADLARWAEAGVEKVQWLAVLEANTCDVCAEHDGRIYELGKVPDTVPAHPNCKCTLAPYEDRENMPTQRVYKDEDGNYQATEFAPYEALIDSHGALRMTPLMVPDAFWKVSSFNQYAPPKHTTEFTGEVPEDTRITDRIARGVEDVRQAFPEIADTLDQMGEIQLHRGTWTIDGRRWQSIGGQVDWKNQTVTITYPKTPTLEAFVKMANDQFKAGNWSTNSIYHTTRHELGHVLARATRKDPSGRTWKALTKTPAQIIQKATGTTNWEDAQARLANTISKRATKDADEAFAELFARGMDRSSASHDKITATFMREVNRSLAEKPWEKKKTL